MPRRTRSTDTLEHQTANGHDALKASGAITLPPGAPLPEVVLRRQRDRDDVVLMPPLEQATRDADDGEDDPE